MKRVKPTKRLPSGSLTFMFTDIVFSAEIQRIMPGESSSERSDAFLKLIKRPHDRIVRTTIASHGGTIIKGTGDGFLVTFKDAEKAVLCGVKVQEKLKQATIQTPPSGQLQIRIGLNSGYAEPRKNDYVSSAVDKAKRVESHCVSGQVYLSSETYGLVAGKLPTLLIQSVGFQKMKSFGKQKLFVAVRLDQTARQNKPNDGLLHELNTPFDLTLRKAVVVIGDEDEKRFEWFKALLAEVYQTEAVQARTLEAVKKLARKLSDSVTFRAIFLADSLPLSLNFRKMDPRINFSKLEEMEQFYESDFCCIVTGKQEPGLEGLVRTPHIIYAPSLSCVDPNRKKLERERVLSELARLRRIRPVQVLPSAETAIQISSIAKVAVWDHSDGALRRQIRALSELRDLDDGYENLLHLIRDSLGGGTLASLELKSLGQGTPGSRMFRLIATRGRPVRAASRGSKSSLSSESEGETKEYVLKLRDTLTPLETEVRSYNQNLEIAGVPGGYLPILGKPVSPFNVHHGEQKFIAQYARWFAIHYHLPGGNNLNVIDLETVLIAAPSELKEKTKGTNYEFRGNNSSQLIQYRLQVFESVLEGLCNRRSGKKVLRDRKRETIWKIQDAPEEEPAILPPYQLTRVAKGRIQDFLDSPAVTIGRRLVSRWEDHLQNVITLVSDSSTAADLGWLSGSIPFTLSPIRGDLNANNVLLRLEHADYPFIIDLPPSQKVGHCLQDFARLEVEIKLTLMDRQNESPVDTLAAYDYTVSQVPIWIELEGRLLADRALDRSSLLTQRLGPIRWKAAGYKNNVELCHHLVMLLRRKACEIQQNRLDSDTEPAAFAHEYLPALLYHSVLAIGYSSLPLFKRLLAVQAASSIFERLK